MALNIDAWTCCCLSSIPTGSIGVVQTFGEYQGWQEPGCSCICFPCTTVLPVSLAVNQLTCKSECKTKDNVTVVVVTAVQYRILKDMVKVATFDIASPLDQIRAEVDNVLRSTFPSMTLDESYEAKEKMVAETLESVRQAMGQYGYEILNVLITDTRPEKSVLDAMNEINASRRREAAVEKGEANKLLKIKASEADAEAKRLAGVGMANMRAAMAQGFQDSMKFMKESGMNEKEAMHMMIMTQYLDTLRDFAGSHGSIVVPSCDGPFKTSKNPISSQKPKPQTPHPPKKKKKKKKKSSVPAGASSDSANCGISDPAAGSIGVVQKFGAYQGWQEPGCSCICFPCTTVLPVSLAVNQLTCKSDCKTRDNVTVVTVTAVQYRILKDMVKVATFDIASPHDQIRAEVDNVLRSTIPSMTLDESYEAKEKMVAEILESVRKAMGQYGYEILNVLITDIRPEKSVLDAMNEINASRRRREAAFEKGEADKLLKIKASEADAEAKRLAGVGMANMRAAMAQGFQDSMKFMKESGMNEKEAMHMMIMTQYLDTLKEFASTHGSIVVPHGPSAVRDLRSQMPEPAGPSGAVPQRASSPKLCWTEDSAQ
ncbi:HIR1 [Symbiodinium microadriaticum]|nr:HIR1 [Symbiodinium microadriaticum]CAE7911415.1 HIR1 [Symbiodinium sp. KB8]